ncbi:protein NDR1-like [Mangifera indica]|uniref:protein NDR1-like n=1 Tax=Mangifera indica TaxID=29780 RepID=UPI001CFA9B6D|nr:protein NDR1-like [Mangifera indica]
MLKGIYYDPVNVTLVNKSNTTTYIGNYVIPNFYQGFRKTAKKDDSVDVDKEVAKRAVLDNGTALFRVDLATAVRFRGIFGTTKRHRIMAGADVEVNDRGTRVDQKNVKLSQATRVCGLVVRWEFC